MTNRPAFPPPVTPAAGWYPDPSGAPFEWFFDGYRWTVRRPLNRFEPVVEHPTLPLRVSLGAVVILASSLVASRPLLDRLIDRDWSVVALMAVAVAVGYGPSVVWLVVASRRWGSGRPLADYGVRFRWSDLLWAPLVWLSTLMAMGATLAVLRAVDAPYRGNLDLSIVAELNRTHVASLVVSTVVVAPFVEEAIFRGAVLRGLLSVGPAPVAILVQGILFGAAHFNPEFGRDNIGLLIVLAVTGISFGIVAYWKHRVGIPILAHAILNGVAVTVALNT